MTKNEAMKLALEALEWSWGGEPLGTKEVEAMSALRQALDRPEHSLPSLTADQKYIDTEQAEAYVQAVRDEALEKAIKAIEGISVPAGNSAAGELAADWTMNAMREARDAIRALKKEQSGPTMIATRLLTS